MCALPGSTVADACRAIGTDAAILSLDPHSLRRRAGRRDGSGAGSGRHTGRAEELVAALRARLHAVERAVAGGPRPRVLVLEWTDPPYLAGHWVPELVRRAGGTPGHGRGGRAQRGGAVGRPARGGSRGRRAVRLRAATGPWNSARGSPRTWATCRWSRSTRRATSCRPGPRWWTGSRRSRGRCIPTRCPSPRRAGSPGSRRPPQRIRGRRTHDLTVQPRGQDRPRHRRQPGPRQGVRPRARPGGRPRRDLRPSRRGQPGGRRRGPRERLRAGADHRGHHPRRPGPGHDRAGP